MKGFYDEKELWQYQRRHLCGRWDRYELITPAGHPDVKGSFEQQIIYIENKIGVPDVKAMETSQVAYIKWLQWCRQRVYVCFGSTKDKRLAWRTLADGLLYEVPPPRFWSDKPIRR